MKNFTQEELEAIEEHGLKFYLDHEPDSLRVFIDNTGIEDLGNFEDAYCGVFTSYDGEDGAIGRYAEELCDDLGDLRNVPDFIKYHIDWLGVGRDFRIGGDNYALPLPGNGLDYVVFRNI